MSNSEVRIACPKDEESLMHLCRLLHKENAILEMDEDKVRHLIRCALYPKIYPPETDKRHKIVSLVGVIGGIGNVEAMCIMILSQMWYSRQDHLEEIVNYVSPEYRQSAHARSMLKFMKKTAKELSMPLIVGIISNKDTKRKCDFYDRVLPKVGHYYLYNGQTGATA